MIDIPLPPLPDDAALIRISLSLQLFLSLRNPRKPSWQPRVTTSLAIQKVRLGRRGEYVGLHVEKMVAVC